MATDCWTCGRSLGFCNKKYYCTGCGATVCSHCVRFLDLSYKVRIYRDIYRYDENNFFGETFFQLPGVTNPKHTWFGSYYLCPQCASMAESIIQRLRSICDAIPPVEFVSSNYRGHKDFSGDPISIESNWYRDFENAKLQVGIIAAFLGCDMVLNTAREERTNWEDSDKKGSKGTHYYKEWRYTGYAVKRK